MAAPITHMVLAKEFLRHHPITGNAKDFVVGASFPDIRYLGVIAREETHRRDGSLKSILDASDAFEAGMRHHALVDTLRERFIQGQGAYALAPKSKYITQALKLFEDEMLYGRFGDWDGTAGFFNDALDQEMRFPIAANDIARWHCLLREYIRYVPSPDTRRTFILGIGLTGRIADEVEQIVGALRQNEEITAIFNDLYKDFTAFMSPA